MRFNHYKYVMLPRFGTKRHNWSLVGPLGAIHFYAHEYTPSMDDYNGKLYDTQCGLEFHRGPMCKVDRAPDHIKCELLEGPCWHDGTSLYATDHLWPLIKVYLKEHRHADIFTLLEQEYDSHFSQYEKNNA